MVALDGVSSPTVYVRPKNYYVVVEHRNHLGAMSYAPIVLSATPTTVDFKNSGFTTHGSNAQVVLTSGDMALWTGDTSLNNDILFSGANNDANTIKDFVLADPANGFGSVSFQSTGYLSIDVDLNGFGKFSGSDNDSNIIKDNVLAHPNNRFGSPSYTINPTIPPEN